MVTQYYDLVKRIKKRKYKKDLPRVFHKCANLSSVFSYRLYKEMQPYNQPWNFEFDLDFKPWSICVEVVIPVGIDHHQLFSPLSCHLKLFRMVCTLKSIVLVKLRIKKSCSQVITRYSPYGMQILSAFMNVKLRILTLN